MTLEWLLILGIQHGYDTPTVRREDTRRLVREVLRLYPTAWRLLRVAAADHDLAGVRVHEGEHVLIGTHALHRSAAVWDGPRDFRPSRWEQPTDEQRRSYLPFGKGDTMCLAGGFAVKALEHLGHLLLRSHEGHVRLRGRTPHVRTLLAPPAGWTRLTPPPHPGTEPPASARRGVGTARPPVTTPRTREPRDCAGRAFPQQAEGARRTRGNRGPEGSAGRLLLSSARSTRRRSASVPALRRPAIPERNSAAPSMSITKTSARRRAAVSVRPGAWSRRKTTTWEA